MFTLTPPVDGVDPFQLVTEAIWMPFVNAIPTGPSTTDLAALPGISNTSSGVPGSVTYEEESNSSTKHGFALDWEL